jgi:hypothetical protein
LTSKISQLLPLILKQSHLFSREYHIVLIVFLLLITRRFLLAIAQVAIQVVEDLPIRVEWVESVRLKRFTLRISGFAQRPLQLIVTLARSTSSEPFMDNGIVSNSRFERHKSLKINMKLRK